MKSDKSKTSISDFHTIYSMDYCICYGIYLIPVFHLGRMRLNNYAFTFIHMHHESSFSNQQQQKLLIVNGKKTEIGLVVPL